VISAHSSIPYRLEREKKWIVENYLRYDQDEGPASDVKNDQVIDFILSRRTAKELCIYQCLSCGNVMIETDPFSNKFATFTAGDQGPSSAGILQSTGGQEGPSFTLHS
jgi:hypothetical protein